MAKKIILGDLHFGANGIEFTERSLKYLNMVFGYAKENKIETVIQLGDTFDTPKSTNTKIVSLVKKKYFGKFSKKLKLITLIGNHDAYYHDNGNDHSLVETYENSNITVITKPTEIDGDIYLPYHFENVDFTKYRDIFGHLDMINFPMNNFKLSDKGHNKLDFKSNRNVISGHYHNKNFDGNIKYVGTPYQTDFGMFGSKPGVHVYDDETGELEFIENEFSPKFIKVFYDNGEIEIEGKEGSDIKDDYIDLYIRRCDVVKALTKFKAGLNNIKYESNLEIYSEFSNDISDKIDDEMVMIKEYFNLNYSDNQYFNAIRDYFVDVYNYNKEHQDSVYMSNTTINIDRLEIQNFMGYKKKFSFDIKKGFHAIFGKTGEGKTTILEAIFFALYGKSLTGKNLPTLVNKDVKKKLLVDISLTCGNNKLDIIRGISPKKISLEFNGEEVKDGVQEKIEKYIGLTPGQFKYLVLKNKDIYKEFTSMSKGDKRDFIDKMFNLDIFSDILETVKSDLKNTKKKIEESNRDMEEFGRLLQLEESRIEELENVFKRGIKEKIEILEDSKTDILSHMENIGKLHEDRDNLIEENKNINVDRVEEEYKNKLIKLDEECEKLKTTQSLLKENYDKDIENIEKRLTNAITERIGDIDEIKDKIVNLDDDTFMKVKESEISRFRDIISELPGEHKKRVDAIKDNSKKLLTIKEKGEEKLITLESSFNEVQNADKEIAKFNSLVDQLKEMKKVCGTCDKISNFKDDIKKKMSLIEDYKKLASKNKYIKREIENIKDNNIKIDQKIYANNQDIESLNSFVEDNTKNIHLDIEKIENEIERFKNNLDKSRSELELSLEKINVEYEQRKNDLEQKKINLKNQLNVNIEKFNNSINEIENKKILLKKSKDEEIIRIEDLIKSNEKKISELLDEILRINKERDEKIAEIDDKIRKISSEKFECDTSERDRIKNLQRLTDEKLDKYYVDEVVQTTISKMLVSKDSIKNFIIKHYIPFVNIKFHEYFKKYSLPFQVIWDENFDAILTGSNYEGLSISNLSTGQRKSIDLCMVFTFNDLQEEIFDAKLGFVFYDEIISGLDENKFNITLDILKDIGNDRAIYVIEHRIPDISRFETIYEVNSDPIKGSIIQESN